jgi:hypothetical protein
MHGAQLIALRRRRIGMIGENRSYSAHDGSLLLNGIEKDRVRHLPTCMAEVPRFDNREIEPVQFTGGRLPDCMAVGIVPLR